MAPSKTGPGSVTVNRFSILDEDAVKASTVRDNGSDSDDSEFYFLVQDDKEYARLYNSFKEKNPRIAQLLKQSSSFRNEDEATSIPLRDVSTGLIRSAQKTRRKLELEIPVRPVMKLCSLCRPIFAEEHDDKWFTETHPHHDTQASLDRSVAFGCEICQNFQAALKRKGLKVEENQRFGHIVARRGVNFKASEEAYGWWAGYRFKMDNHLTTLLDWVIVRAESLQPHLIKTPLSTSTKHMDWDIVRYWLHKCRSDHTECGRITVGPKVLPTRLLEVRMSEHGLKANLRCNIKDENLEYVTLSHCWGTNKIFTLTVRNLERLCKDVPINKLPQVFQDAIWVTLKLGVQHIWIDSLCICQGPDGQRDWLNELPRMSSVYRNSYCNIAATGFADGRKGLFVNRRTEDLMPRFVETNWTGSWKYPEGARKDTYFIADDRSAHYDVSDAPLNHRAWVVQERFLSPCTLHFGERQVYWECSEMCCSEIFPTGLPEDFAMLPVKFSWYHDQDDPLVKQLSKAFDKRLWKLGGWRHQPKQLYGLWGRLVAAYSIGNLTRPLDKIPAIAGIAVHFQTLLDDEYVAGLWRKNIIRDLLWNVTYESNVHLHFDYRAPSWSWASLDAAVSFNWCEKSEKGETILAELVDVQVTTLGADGYGPVTSGFLKVVGHLFPLQVYARSLMFEEYHIYGKVLRSLDLEVLLDMGPSGHRHSEVRSATLENQLDGAISVKMSKLTALSLFQGRIYILPLRIDEDDETEWPYVFCLLLGFSGHVKGQYIRLGVCRVECKHFDPLLTENGPVLDEKLYDKRVKSDHGTRYQITIV